MTTYPAKIPRFRCSYFRLWPCVPLFGPGGPVFKVRRSRAKFHVFVAVISELGMCCATIVWKFRVFVAAISGLCVRRDRSRVKIPRFRCGYFRLVCVCVCVCVCLCVCLCMCRDATQSCENSVFSLRLSPAYMCALVLFVWTGPGRLQGAHLNCGNFRIWNWMCCHNSAFAIFGYSKEINEY